MKDQILIFHFHCQFLINFIQEHNLLNNPMVKRRLKSSLETTYSLLTEQMNIYVKGDALHKQQEFTNDVMHNTQQGVLSIEEYFNVLFNLAEIPKEQQESFQIEFEDLVKKYKL